MKYPVFRIDFNEGLYTQSGVLEATIESYIANWEVEYGKNPLDTTIGTRFKGVLQRAYEYLKFVLLTGVTKFSQESVFSGFNHSRDLTMRAVISP